MPSPLFNVLFLVALFVPAAMYLGGVLLLMASLVIGHWRVTHREFGVIEAPAH
jgi:hypothetical protein